MSPLDLSSASVVGHLGFLKLNFLTAVALERLLNFVEIDNTVAEISQFFAFSSELDGCAEIA